jgi:DNA polymerase III epsilon subunit-like protein
MNPNDITDTYTRLMTLLAEEERAHPTTDFARLQARYQRRQAVAAHLSTLESAVYALSRRINHLPQLADIEQVRWAQALLAFPNLAFLEVDTDGLREDADILRVLVLDKHGTPLHDQIFQPRRSLVARIIHVTALTPDMVEHAPRISDEWERLAQALAGRYVVSFNLDFDQSKLRENAERYQLTPLSIIGTCLMLASQTYFQRDAYPKLETLCAQIGFPLPEHPHQDALHRARGQLHLLEAMAQGITNVPPSDQDSSQDRVNQGEAADPFLPDD